MRDYDEELQIAAETGDLNEFKLLLMSGADPLIIASDFGNLEIVKYIVEELEVCVTNFDNQALRYAAESGRLEVVKYLVEQGADVSAGAEYAIKNAANNGHYETVKYLVEKGADFSIDEEEVISSACAEGHLEMVKYLYDCGADITQGDPNAIDCACRNEGFEIIEFFIDQGNSPEYLLENAQLEDNYYPEKIKFLLDKVFKKESEIDKNKKVITQIFNTLKDAEKSYLKKLLLKQKQKTYHSEMPDESMTL